MEYIITITNKGITLPSRGYFQKGDSGDDIAVISSFLALNFMGYEDKINVKIEDMLGYYFGKNLEAWVKEFQRENNLKDDGCIGKITLGKLREFGLSL